MLESFITQYQGLLVKKFKQSQWLIITFLIANEADPNEISQIW